MQDGEKEKTESGGKKKEIVKVRLDHKKPLVSSEKNHHLTDRQIFTVQMHGP